jgi:hypothetical protein
MLAESQDTRETKFLYLIHDEKCADLGRFRTSQSEYIQLVWNDLASEHCASHAIFYPNSTVQQQRDRLYFEVQNRFPRDAFKFLIFAHGSVVLEEVKDYGMNTGDPWRTLERYLIKYEPALASPSAPRFPQFSCDSNRLLDHPERTGDQNSSGLPEEAPNAEVEVVFDHEHAGVMIVHSQASRSELLRRQMGFSFCLLRRRISPITNAMLCLEG